MSTSLRRAAGIDQFSACGRRRIFRKDGYVMLTVSRKYVYEHVVVAERALGRPLKGEEEIHHLNGVRDDNRPGNLVICPTREYHRLLHVRQAALEETGDPEKRRCRFCKEYDDPKNLRAGNRGWNQPRYEHGACSALYQRNRIKRIKEVENVQQTS